MEPGLLPLPQVSLHSAICKVLSIATYVDTGVGLYLNGSVLSNNSIVLLSEIREGNSALYCLTDRTACCSIAAGGSRGAWRFPNGTFIENNFPNIYRTRGFSSLFLNRRSSAVGPTGVYTCLIPDARNILRTFYIGVYSAGGGEF